MVKAIAAALFVGAGLVVLVAATWPSWEPPAAAAVAHEEKAWLSNEAAQRIFGADNYLGPVFEGAILGGTAPTRETRDRIAAFAAANDIKLGLEIRDDELRGITFDVTFGGCCGYEGVDKLALRLGRPHYAESCGAPGTWVDNWVLETEPGSRMRVAIYVNRLVVHWEPTLPLPALLAAADQLLGERIATVRRRAGTDLRETGADRYLLEMPFVFAGHYSWPMPGFENRFDLGLQLATSAGEIVEVAFSLPEPDSDVSQAAQIARWGTPKENPDDGTWTWKQPTREIQKVRSDHTITIRTIATRDQKRKPASSPIPNMSRSRSGESIGR